MSVSRPLLVWKYVLTRVMFAGIDEFHTRLVRQGQDVVRLRESVRLLRIYP